MANLIIKPASGSGNKVIFQNQAGTVDAITVEDSGAIAVAGNTTLSGTSNNIGTVTSGTFEGILNTSTTLPAGHIVQLATPTTGTNESSHSAQNTWADTVIAGNITPRYSDSNILIMATFTAYIYNTSGDAGYAFRWKRTISSSDTYPSNLTKHTGTNYHGQMYINPMGVRSEDVDHRTEQLIDFNVGTTSEVTYTMQAGTYNANNCQIGGTYSAHWYLYLFEIKG